MQIIIVTGHQKIEKKKENQTESKVKEGFCHRSVCKGENRSDVDATAITNIWGVKS